MGTIQIPTSLLLDIPDTLRGEKGDQGEPGQDGRGLLWRGQWTPVIGGLGGESGQTYRYQWGEYRIADGICFLRGYVQFEALGTILGPLALRGLPVPTANTPGFYGGHITYFSNPHPDSPCALTLRASGNATFAMIDGIPAAGFNPPSCTVNTINPHTQLVIVFDYFTD